MLKICIFVTLLGDECIGGKNKKQNPPEITRPLARSPDNSINWSEQRSMSPALKTLGRQKRIIEPSLTPASTPIPSLSTPQNIEEIPKALNRGDIKHFDLYQNYASPETPLSKMDLMIQPSAQSAEALLCPRSIVQLEIPSPERLLPIGQYGKEGICALVDKVREALTIPDISHLKQTCVDKSEVSTIIHDMSAQTLILFKSRHWNYLIIHFLSQSRRLLKWSRF